MISSPVTGSLRTAMPSLVMGWQATPEEADVRSSGSTETSVPRMRTVLPFSPTETQLSPAPSHLRTTGVLRRPSPFLYSQILPR